MNHPYTLDKGNKQTRIVYAKLAALHPALPHFKYDQPMNDEEAEKNIDERNKMLSPTENTRRGVVRNWLAKNWQSSQIICVILLIQKCLKDHGQNNTDRVILFAASLAYLDFLHAGFRSNDLPCFQYDRSVSQIERAEMVVELNDVTNLKVRIMFITQWSGSLSTDFIDANRVILAQPQALPATKDQALGRAYSSTELVRANVSDRTK